MLYSGTDPESYITEYTAVFEERQAREGEASLERRSYTKILQGVTKRQSPLEAHCFKSHPAPPQTLKNKTHQCLHSTLDSSTSSWIRQLEPLTTAGVVSIDF